MRASLRPLTALLSLALAAAVAPGQGADSATSFVVIANPNVARVDAQTLQRLYTGRAIEAAGVPVTVVNTPSGSPLRERFLADVVGLDNDRYIAYWTVRRHVGKGVPPRELKSGAEVIDFVLRTPGGMGYIPINEVRPGLNVVFKP
jgi:hypothetical protein